MNHLMLAFRSILLAPLYWNWPEVLSSLKRRLMRAYGQISIAGGRLALPGLTWAIYGAALLPADAQWITQSMKLNSGWNAVYLHVDASHDSLDNMIKADSNNPITEVWLWSPPSTTLQFVQSPQKPNDNGSQWLCWVRNSSTSATMNRLAGNAAYLVRVGTNAVSYTWNVKGKPLAPVYEWTTKGLNFIGFPTVSAPAPSFDSYLAHAPELQQNGEIYQYPGGELGENNPQRIYALRTTPVNRGQAYWIRAGNTYNRYFAPFEVDLSSANGINFGDSLTTASFRLRNLTTSNLTVSLKLLGSEAPPAGQSAIVDVPPLLIRGSLNLTNLTYFTTNLPINTAREWKLAPAGQEGSGVEVVLGLNRGSINRNVGEVLAGVMRFTDATTLAQVDVSVSATVGSSAGLWVGNAVVTQVAQYLKTYQRDGAGNMIMQPNGQYSVSRTNTELSAVAHPFSWRLIVHNPSSGSAKLLQRVYVGPNANTNMVVANSESALHPAYLNQARRISSIHLPWTLENPGWSFNERFGSSSNLTVTLTLNYGDKASNPFLHSYHPDHDNLDSEFKAMVTQGSESYTIQREVTLNVKTPAEDFASQTATGQSFSGDYSEMIRILGLARSGGTTDMRIFEIRGSFVLRRIADIPTLTVAP